jgi:hypothetical protein
MIACLAGFGGGSSVDGLERMWVCIEETDPSNCTNDTNERMDSRVGTITFWLVDEFGLLPTFY